MPSQIWTLLSGTPNMWFSFSSLLHRGGKTKKKKKKGLSWWLSGKESVCQCRRCKRCRFNPWGRKNPWRRKWQPTPVFLPGESHGQRSLAGYNHSTFSIMLHSRQRKEKGTGQNLQAKCICPLSGDFPEVTLSKFHLHLIGHKVCHKTIA